MNRFCIAAATLLTVFALAPTQAAAPVGVLLKYKYTPGEVLRYRLTQDMKSSTMMGAGSMPMMSHATSEFTQTVQSVDSRTGNATLVVKSSAPKMTMTINGKATPMQMPASTAMTMTEVISPGGKPVSVDMGGAAGAQMSASGLGGGMSSLFSGGGFGQYSAFPANAVRIGDVWRNEIALGQTGSKMFIKQSLVGLNASGGHPVANIASRYTMNMNMTPKIGVASGFQMTSTATGTGHTLFDVDQGAMNSTSMLMNMMMTTKAPAGLAGGIGPVNTHMTMSLRIDRIGG